jgi:WD40 repeat protein
MTDPPAGREPAPDGAPESPYVGLVPYGEEDAAFFFGRDEEKRIVGGNLRAFRLTLFYGESGVGKTSLLRAGVIHELRELLREDATEPLERASFAICAFSAWRDDPLAALMETIRVAASEALRGAELAPWRPGDSVAEALRSWTERVRTLLVVLDQFEDYFLYHPDEHGEGTFAGEFPGIVNEPNLRVNFLLSIREDGLAKLDRFKGRIARLFANYVRIEHLSRAAARDAIDGPIRVWNGRLPPGESPYTLEPALVEAVIDAAATGRVALGPGTADAVAAVPGVERVEAPFLQLVMERLWRATVSTGSRDLTVSRLEQLGGAQRIVENHLLEALGALTPSERAVAADLFRFLVTSSKTKIAHQVPDLAEWTGRSQSEVTTVLDKLCRGESGRILRRIPPPPAGGGDTRYELFHDVLAEPIVEWRRDYEQEQRRRATVRRFVRVGGVLVSLVAVFAALGIWALVQRSDARSATRSATSLALASAASAQVDDHVEKSLLLGLGALRASPSAEASSAMVEALEVARRSGAKAILRGGADGVRTIAYSPDGRTLASADFDGTVRLWDTKARTTLGEPFRAHTNEVWGLSFSPDGGTLASASFDGTVRLWNVEDQRPLGAPIDADVGAVRSVTFSPDGRTVAFGGSDDSVRIWDVRAGKAARPPLRGHRSSVMAVAFSPDGRTLASGGADLTVRLWDLRTRKQGGRALDGHTGTIVSVAFSPDGRTLASSDLAGDVRLWDVETREPLGEPLQSETGQVWGVAFSPDGRTLASSGFDGTVRLWGVQAGSVAAEPLRGHSRAVIGVAYGSDGTLASASYDGTVRLWDGGETGGFGEPLGAHEGRVTTISISPDGRTLASGGFDSTIRLWDVRARRSLGELGAGRTDSLESVAFSPDGRTLAAADVEGSIWLWEMPGGTQVGRLRGHGDAVQSISFGPDGEMLASASSDETVRLWDLETKEQIGEPLAGHEGSVSSVAFSSDGRTLASGGSDGTLHLWDIAEHGAAGLLPLAEGEVVQTVAFAPDGRTLASGSVGGLVRLWDVRAREAVGEPLDEHVQDVEDVAFSPDGRTLASASSDGTVRLWDVPGRRALGQPLRGHTGPVFGVAFSPDERTVASGGDDETVRLWEGILWRELADLETEVCRLVVRNLSEAEWEELVPGLPYRTTCPT